MNDNELKDSLDRLTDQWQMVRQREKLANAERLEIEKQICHLLPSVGAESIQKFGMGDYMLKVEYPLTRKIDADALSTAWADLPENARGAIQWKPFIRVPALRALQQLAPYDYAMIAPFITTTPAKPSIEIVTAKETA